MHRFFEDYVDRLTSLHNDYKKAIDGLNVEALDWVPGAEMNSLCVMIVHMTAVERYLVGDMAAHINSNRVRVAEFQAKGLDEATLTKRMDDALAFVKDTVTNFTLEDLTAVREIPAGGNRPATLLETLTVGWALEHALSHTALHLGHAQITRQLWDQHKS
ncbi:MAG: DUF664 domain-containing protein [Anaerolineaceae bacterium]|nr:DUF664 domain-containing protein [Anaerolineaceae bacterium]